MKKGYDPLAVRRMRMMILLWIFVALVAGFIGSYVAGGKNRNQMTWFWLCALFPFMVLIILVLPALASLDSKPHQKVYFQEDWPKGGGTVPGEHDAQEKETGKTEPKP